MGPFNFDPRQMVQQMMQQNPNMFRNNPQAQAIADVIMSGDAKRGEEMARNFCQSYNVTPEEGVQQAQQFFKNNARNIFGGG